MIAGHRRCPACEGRELNSARRKGDVHDNDFSASALYLLAKEKKGERDLVTIWDFCMQISGLGINFKSLKGCRGKFSGK